MLLACESGVKDGLGSEKCILLKSLMCVSDHSYKYLSLILYGKAPNSMSKSSGAIKVT